MSTISLDPVTVDYLISHFPNLDSLDAQLDTQWCDINRRKEELLLRVRVNYYTFDASLPSTNY